MYGLQACKYITVAVIGIYGQCGEDASKMGEIEYRFLYASTPRLARGKHGLNMVLFICM